MSAGRKLVIVESPAKARTIAGYLGDGYDVEASVGHIRDLPQPSELPADMKKGPFGKFAVDVDNGFAPYYVVDADKKKKVSELKKLLKDSDELFLATDEDREGEAIAWHLLQELKPKVPVKRMVFHEITREAIQRALANTRELDDRLVDAQETRRILDRLYGYEVSPVLWRKVRQGLSAGRVQSVATRLVVERERERMAFVAADYWDVTGTFAVADAAEPAFSRAAVVGQRAARGHRPRLRRQRHAASRPTSCTSTRRSRRALVADLADADVLRRLAGDQAVHAPPGRAVHHLDAAAGGLAQAADGVPADHAHRAGPVRERLHHLHAYGLLVAERAGDRRRAPAGVRAVRARVRARRARASTRARPRAPRRRTRPSGPPVTTSAPPRRWPRSCRATSSGCTS